MGTRHEQKEQRREKMLKSAQQLFAKKGYQQTSFEDIAKKSGFAVPTIFKYFGTKKVILEECIRPEFEKMYTKGDRILKSPPDDPVEGIMKLFDLYGNFASSWRDRDFMGPLNTIPSGDNKSSKSLPHLIVWSAQRAEQQIRDFLRIYQMRGRIPEDNNVADMATVIFAVFRHEFLFYITHENITVRQIFSSIKRLINASFIPWLA